MNQKQSVLIQGSIFKAVWHLGWPAVLAQFMETFLSITNAFWVGRLGPVEMAAVTSSMFPIWTIFSTLTIISTGVVAIISRAAGAGEADEVTRTARQGLMFALWAGIGYGFLGYAVTPLIFKVMGTEEAVTQLGINYLRIFFAGSILFAVSGTLGGIFRAVGDARAAMIASLSAVLINVGMDPLLIFGIGPFPRWGTSGASIATLISVACGVIVYLFMIKRGRLKYDLHFGLRERLDFGLIKSIVKIGFPQAVAGMIFSVVYIFLNRIVNNFGTISIAALMIGNRMESLSYLTSFGFSMASATMVGQNLGAGRPQRAAKAAWVSVGICVGLTSIIAMAFLLFPRSLSAFFIHDEAVIAIATGYLRILALSQMFMAAEIVLEGSFAGAGNTIPPMAVSIPGSIARLPLAYYLCFVAGFGIDGVWWALTITSWVKALILLYWFWLGKWKKTGLIPV